MAPAADNDGGGQQRVGTMTSMRSLFDRRRPFFPWAARLGNVRRLYGTVVGPSLAADSMVRGVFGEKLVIAVRRHPVIANLKSVEPYLLRMLGEHLGGRPIKVVQYYVDAQLDCETAPRVPRRPS